MFDFLYFDRVSPALTEAIPVIMGPINLKRTVVSATTGKMVPTISGNLLVVTRALPNATPA